MSKPEVVFLKTFSAAPASLAKASLHYPSILFLLRLRRSNFIHKRPFGRYHLPSSTGETK